MNYIIELLIKTLLETAYLTGIVFLAGFLLGILRNSTLRNFQRSFGMKAVMVTGLIGVPVHELSHAIFAVVFGHKITDIKLLQKPDINGTMGYVRHTYYKGSIYQQAGNFFIGIAPIFGGVFSIVAIMRGIIPEAYIRFTGILGKALNMTMINKYTIEGIISAYIGFVKNIFSSENFGNPYFYLFIWIAMCISSHISLSSEDIKGASKGLGIIFIILLSVNVLGLSKYISETQIIKYNILITSVLTVAIVLSLVTFFISLILKAVKIR